MLHASEIKKLRKSIPHGKMRELHELINQKGIEISYDMVAAVINGRVYKQEVLDIAIEYAASLIKEQEQVTKQTAEKINNLVN